MVLYDAQMLNDAGTIFLCLIVSVIILVHTGIRVYNTKKKFYT